MKANFIDLFQQKKTRRRKIFLVVRILLYVFFGIIILNLIFLAPYFYTIQNVYKEAQTGKQNLEKAAECAKNLNVSLANFYLALAEENFNEAYTDLNKLKFLKDFPWIEKQYKALTDLLLTSIRTTSALRDVIGVADEIMRTVKKAQEITEVPLPQEEMTFARLNAEQKKKILQSLYEAPPKLQGAKAKIDLALIAIEQIEESEVTRPILEAIKPFREILPKVRETIVKLIPLAEIVPPVAGYPTPKTYLFLLQNSDELRPTGGFIGTYGILKIKEGEIEDFKTYNIYTLDGPAESFLRVEPPWQIKKYLRVNWWFMRDSNWSPDFPTSAAKAEWFYHAEKGPEEKIDAVIAVTPTFVQNLLFLVGNIELEEEIYTPENFMDLLQYKVEKEYYEKKIPEIQRKDIVYKLADKLFEKLIDLPFSRWREIFQIIENQRNEKNILLWSKDPELQSLILSEGWGGEVKDVSGDFLMVVDANLASLKTDRVVERKINYSLWRDKLGIHAKTVITYKNKGWFDWRTTRYRTYTRVYVPEGSKLIKAVGAMENDKIFDPRGRPGQVEVKNELGKTYFGAFISIEPGQTKSLEFEYLLPAKISDDIQKGLYKLFVQKQAGTSAVPLTLNLNFDKKIKRANPAEKKEEWNDNIYKLETDLRTDREFEVGF